MTDKSTIRREYLQYAEDVVSGREKVGEFVQLCMKRYLSWFDRDDMIFRQEKVDKFMRFARKLQHSKGRFAGVHFNPMPWQIAYFANVYGWYWADDPERRVIKTCFVMVPRKNGKTELVASQALYNMVIEEEGAEAYAIANSLEQARVLFEACSNFTNRLQGGSNKGIFKVLRKTIEFKSRKSKLVCLASDTTRLDGLGPSFVCQDEVEAARTSEIRDVMVSGMGHRINGLYVMIGTAGFDTSWFAYLYRATCIEILKGLKTDDTVFPLLYELDEGDDPFVDPSCYKKANPSLGITVQESFLKSQIQEATNTVSLQSGVLVKNFNRWCSSEHIWIPPTDIMNTTQTVDIKKYDGYTAFMGVDLAATGDLTCLCACIPDEDTGEWAFKWWAFLPEAALSNSPNSIIYREWAKQGFIELTPGNVTDYEYITKRLEDINKVLYIDTIFVDRYNATQWTIEAQDAGYNVTPYSQTIGSMNIPCREFERLVLMKKDILDNNPVFRWCVQNSAVKEDHSMNRKIVKGSGADNKIDLAVAALIALGGALTTSRYSRGDIMFSSNA